MSNDQALLAQLRSTFEIIDPVPLAVVDLARASLTWRDPDAALADLVADSLADAGMVRTRGSAGPRLLTFQADDLTIEVEVAEDDGSCRLLGQLVPPSRADVLVRWAAGHTETRADEIGRFMVSGIPSGPVSISCTRERATKPVVTGWVTI